MRRFAAGGRSEGGTPAFRAAEAVRRVAAGADVVECEGKAQRRLVLGPRWVEQRLSPPVSACDKPALERAGACELGRAGEREDGPRRYRWRGLTQTSGSYADNRA